MCTEYKIDKRVTPADFLRHAGLLHHAAAQGDDHAWPGGLSIFQRADVAEHAILRVLTHSTGVIEHQICAFHSIRK